MSYNKNLSIWAGLALLMATSLPAQNAQDPVIGTVQPYEHKTKLITNADPSATVLMDEHFVKVPGRPWLQLHFGELQLGEGSVLQITSVKDGQQQWIERRSQSSRASAVFNGDQVRVRLFAGPRTQNLYSISRIGVGSVRAQTPSDICASDTRAPSADPRCARLIVSTTTEIRLASGFLWSDNNDGKTLNCFITAGNVLALPGLLNVTAQFDVPPSGPDGTIDNPPIDKQVEFTGTVLNVDMAFENGGAGADWGTFTTLVNTSTGKHAGIEQGSAFNLGAPALGSAVVTGFGQDTTPLTSNATQQSATGPITAIVADEVRHRASTSEASLLGRVTTSAGSPITLSGVATAVHTHGGCTATTTTFNSGTSVNRTAFATGRRNVCRRVDLVAVDVKIAGDPTTITAGDTITVTSRVRNDGDVTSSAVPSGHYLSADSTITTADLLIGVPFTTIALQANAIDSQTHQAVVPTAAATGNCWVGAFFDHNNGQVELSETNNTTSIMVQCVAKPNLRSAFRTPIPTTALEGSSITVLFTISNNGGLASPASTTRVILSSSPLLTPVTAFVDVPTAALAALTGTINLSAVLSPLPALTTGTCYVGVVADNPAAIDEVAENDNAVVSSLNCVGKPDLRPTLLSPPALSVIASLQTINLQAQIDNIGGGASVSANLEYWLSANSVVDGGDLRLNTTTISLAGIAAGGNFVHNLAVTLPSDMSPYGAVCHILTRVLNVVGQNSLTDRNPANDLHDRTLNCVNGRPAEDYAATLVTATPTTLIPGTQMTLRARITNPGDVASPAGLRHAFYLSDNTVPAVLPGDVFLADFTTASIAARDLTGVLSPILTGAPLPATIPDGTCFVKIMADSSETRVESDEINNFGFSGALTCRRPDLVVTAAVTATNPTGPLDQWEPQEQVTVAGRITNIGGAPAGACQAAIYLSADTNLDNGDTVLDTFAVNSLAAAAFQSYTRTVVIPDNVPNGAPCWIFVYADIADVVVEASETNNHALIAGTCRQRPDLVAKVLKVENQDLLDPPDSMRAGGASTITFEIENIGRANHIATPGTQILFVLSSIARPSPTDLLLAALDFPDPLLAGRKITRTILVRPLPACVPSARCWVGVIVDADDIVPEEIDPATRRERDNNRMDGLATQCLPLKTGCVLEWKPRYLGPAGAGSITTLRADFRLHRTADMCLACPDPRFGQDAFYLLMWSATPGFTYDVFSSFSLTLLNIPPYFPNWFGVLGTNGVAAVTWGPSLPASFFPMSLYTHCLYIDKTFSLGVLQSGPGIESRLW